jgi:hypothetical protein
MLSSRNVRRINKLLLNEFGKISWSLSPKAKNLLILCLLESKKVEILSQGKLLGAVYVKLKSSRFRGKLTNVDIIVIIVIFVLFKYLNNNIYHWIIDESPGVLESLSLRHSEKVWWTLGVRVAQSDCPFERILNFWSLELRAWRP